MIFTFIGIVLILISIFILYLAHKIKIEKYEEQQLQKAQLYSSIEKLKEQKQQLAQYLNQQKNNIEKELESFQQNREIQLNKDYEKTKKIIQNSIDDEYESAKQQIEKIQNNIQETRQAAKQQKQNTLAELNNIRSTLAASIQTRIRQQEKQNQLKFYQLGLSKDDISDILKLEQLKSSFHNPTVLSKLIWSQYCQKLTNDLCNRVLGSKTVCGIYKITNTLTEECYIGQSVDVAQRWKDHIKCGLGIDAPANNKLYNNMKEHKIWLFTFELLEECSKELLNEKQAYWIETYKSNIYGLNSTKGNKI